MNLLNAVQWARRHERQLADLRSGAVGPTDAHCDHATAIQVLMSDPFDPQPIAPSGRRDRPSRAVVTRARLAGDQAPLPSGSTAPPTPRAGVSEPASTWCWSTSSCATATGAIVKGLTADDFELFEDGQRQQILTFAFEEIS